MIPMQEFEKDPPEIHRQVSEADTSSESSSDPSKNDGPSVGDPEPVDSLANRFRTLETLFIISLAAVLLLAVTANFLLLYQIRLANHHQTNYSRVLSQFKNNQLPYIQNFYTDLEKYSQKDPAFSSILKKYINVGQVPTAPSSGPLPLDR